jgi:hypothetical protein
MSNDTLNSSSLQLKQKILHYKSEIAMYQQKLLEYEDEIRDMKKHQILLKEKLKNNGFIDIETYDEDLAKVRTDLENYKQELEHTKKYNTELNQRIENLKLNTPQPKAIDLRSLFTYTVILPDFENDEVKEVVVVGNYIIKNSGAKKITNPVICIKVNPQNAGSLSGKIKQKATNFGDKLIDDVVSQQWGYVHENWKEKVRTDGEHWLKPLFTNEIQPDEQLVFSNFTLSIQKPQKGNSVIIDAFIYSQEERNGSTSQNQIVLNF